MGTVAAPDGKHVYVSTGRSQMVLFVDTATNQVVGSVEAGPRPWGIAISSDGTTLYTANGPSNDVSVIDVATKQVTKKIPVGRGPWGITVVKQPAAGTVNPRAWPGELRPHMPQSKIGWRPYITHAVDHATFVRSSCLGCHAPVSVGLGCLRPDRPGCPGSCATKPAAFCPGCRWSFGARPDRLRLPSQTVGATISSSVSRPAAISWPSPCSISRRRGATSRSRRPRCREST